MTIAIVLADDHPIVRQGLRTVLLAEPDFAIAGEAADGLETVRLVERLQPDVLVLDLMLPGLSGLKVLPIVHKRSPRTRVAVLSMYADEAFVVEALRNGAIAYVQKGCETRHLVRALREAIAGRRYLSTELSKRALKASLDESTLLAVDPYATLTPREREVLHLAAEGHTNVTIAARICLSPRTVEMHRAHMMRKLSLKTPADLVRFAIRHGIISLQQ